MIGIKMLKKSLLILSIITLLIINVNPPAAAHPDLSAPLLISPEDNSHLNDNTPVFNWHGVYTADNYELQISKNSSFPSDSTLKINNIGTTSYPLPSSMALTDNTYYWRVRAGRENGDVGSWSLTRSFTIDTIPPEAPTLTNPPENSYLNNNVVNLSWTAVDTVDYTLYVDNHPNLSTPIITKTLTSTTFTTPTLPDDSYFWKVKTRDLAGNENSSTKRFYVDTQPPRDFNLLSPTHNYYTNDNTPQLEWEWTVDDTAATHTGRYLFKAQNIDSESQIIFDNVDVSDYDNVWVHVWIKVNEPTKFKRYEFYSGYVSVDGGSWNQFFKDRTTTLGAYQEEKYYVGNNANKVSIKIVFNLEGIGIGSSSKIYYLDDLTITGNLSENEKFENIARNDFELPKENSEINYKKVGGPENTEGDYWGRVKDSGITHYDIYIDETKIENTTDNYLTLTDELTEDSHTWNVVAVDRAGNEAQSPTWIFTIDITPPSAPSKISPSDGTWTSIDNVTLRWAPATDDSSGIDNYEIWIDDNPDFSSPEVKNQTTLTNYNYSDFEDALYYWRVRANDVVGNSGPFENAWSFLVDNTPPGKPTLVYPDNTVENAAVLTFNWRAVSDLSGIDHYEFQLDRENSFSPPIFFEEDNIRNNYYALDQALITDNFSHWYVGTFYWRVKAVDEMGHENEWSKTLPVQIYLRDFNFTINPTSSKIRRTRYGLVKITAERLGSHENIIDLSCSGQPSGVRVFFDAIGAVPSFKYYMTIAVEEEAPIGTYKLTVTGRDSYNNEHSDNYQLTILKKPTVIISRINAGEESTFNIGKQKILKVSISAMNQIENATLTVKEYSEKPSEIPSPKTPTYGYISFETEEIENQDISSATIEFRVSRDWINQNNIDKDTIKLNKYSAGEWRSLSTEESEEYASHICFSAETSEFSIFAITGEEEKPSLLDQLTDWKLLSAIAIIILLLIILTWRKKAPKKEWAEEIEKPPRSP